MSENEEKNKKQFTIRFLPEALDSLDKMAAEEQISKAELIRRAINFYNFKLKAKKENKKVILEDEKTGKQTIILL